MYTESDIVELKRELTKDIKKEIVAFANTNGGTIYIGIDDDGQVIGVKNPTKIMDSIASMVRDAIKGNLIFYSRINSIKIDGKDVVVMNVESGPDKPYYLTDKGLKSSGVYLRYGTVSTQATDEEIKRMLIDNSRSNFETQTSYLQDLHFDYLKSSFMKKGIDLTDAKLKTLHIMDTHHNYTNLGLVFSDECPYYIKFGSFNGKNKTEFRDRKIFQGSILKQLDDLFEYFNLFNKLKGVIVGYKRVDTLDYPDFALRESVLNAVIHQDYSFEGNILVSLFDDRFEILSLGSLVKGVTLEDIYSGISVSRNPYIANVLHKLEYVESFGTGITRILEGYEGSNMMPSFNQSPNSFLVTLPNRNYVPESKINNDKKLHISQVEQVIMYLTNNNSITRLEVEALLGIEKSRAKELLSQMASNNMIILKGSGRTSYYVLGDKNEIHR